MDKESIIPILKETMKRYLRDLAPSALNLRSENFKERSWWDKGNKDFWAASVGGGKRNFASQVGKMSEDEFAELAKLIIEEEQVSRGR